MKGKAIAAVLLVGLVGGAAWVWWGSDDERAASEQSRSTSPAAAISELGAPHARRQPAIADKGAAAAEAVLNAAEGEDEEMGPETAEDKEEKLVEVFDALVDRWTDPSPAGVPMKDIADFSEAFRRLPKSRRDECVHRALNLVPDENVMLLAGLLFGKDTDRESAEIVFNDILNRDEAVKMPILKELAKDRKHPCWADAKWILDVTTDPAP